MPIRTTASPAAHDDIIYPATIPFLLAHVACLGGLIWTGLSVRGALLCFGMYVVRMWIVTAGYHRYFSHRSFKTSRAGQFILAFLCQSSGQRGVLWWAAKHRSHHKYSDTELDPHSPKQHGFWFSHFGWIFAPSTFKADYSMIGDLTKYPELVWLDRQTYAPAAVLGIVMWLVAGWEGLFAGFFLSTILLYHGSFSINSLAHVVGKQRYVTGDDSRNNWWLALITMGEGWHNNHHHFQSSTRQGFYWWEIDFTYYGLKVLSWFRVVWDLTVPPPAVVQGEQRLRRVVVEKVAYQLAHSFPIERITQQICEAWAQKPGFDELRARVASARLQAEAALAEIHLPEIPSVEELTRRAQAMFVQTPSRDEIVARAREIIIQAVSVELLQTPAPA